MNISFEYSRKVYNTKAAKEVIPFIYEIIKPGSVIDVGCGIGTWLKVFHEDYGIDDILGLDAPYLKKEQFLIDYQYFKETDLSIPFSLNRNYDLLLCLEVAEHLPKSAAESFISSLCAHSDTILFSAAIPGQSGEGHINEQWPDYWNKLFNNLGYLRYDLVRPYIWFNEEVDVWYRQNIFLFSKKKCFSKVNSPYIATYVHPEFWEIKTKLLTDKTRELKKIRNGELSFKMVFKIFFLFFSSRLKRLRKRLINIIKKITT